MGRKTLLGGALGAVAAIAAACASYPSIEDPDLATPLPPRTAATATTSAPTNDTPPPPPPQDSGGTDDGGADGGADAGGPRRVFVSSALKTGNLGGVAGADALCNQLATAQGLGGTYRAWLSVAGAPAIDRITSNGPFQLVTGEVVAANKAQLASGQLQRPLNKDEKGATPPAAEDRVWTATNGQGQPAGPDCGQWTGAGSGRVGEAEHASSQWTSLVDEACGEVNRVYCIEL